MSLVLCIHSSIVLFLFTFLSLELEQFNYFLKTIESGDYLFVLSAVEWPKVQISCQTQSQWVPEYIGAGLSLTLPLTPADLDTQTKISNCTTPNSLSIQYVTNLVLQVLANKKLRIVNDTIIKYIKIVHLNFHLYLKILTIENISRA